MQTLRVKESRVGDSIKTFVANQECRESGAPGGAPPSAAENVVKGNGTSSKENQGEGQGGDGEGELISGAIGGADQSIVQVHFPDSDKHIDENGERCSPSEKSKQDHQPAEEFREGGNIAQPCGQAETGHHLGMVMQSAENLVIAMRDHNGAQGQAHYHKR